MGKRKQVVEEESEAESSASEAIQRTVKKPKVLDSKTTTKAKPKSKSSESKDSPKEGSSKPVDTSAQEEKFVDLGKRKRVSISEFKGMVFVDIREFYTKDGKDQPGKKGIALQKDQWEALKANMDTIDELMANYKK